jgi:hypothetical protein
MVSLLDQNVVQACPSEILKVITSQRTPTINEWNAEKASACQLSRWRVAESLSGITLAMFFGPGSDGY